MSTAESSSHAGRVDAAIAEWLEAVEAGRAPNEEEFISRFPDIADDLRKFLDDHRRFDRYAATVADPATPAADRPAADASGRHVGDFEILCELGRGGMGIVYEARQVSLNRLVALKVLSSGIGVEPRAVQRFRREAEAAATLRHPGIVPIFATGEEDGLHFYAMELIRGPSLDRLRAEAPPAAAADFERIAGLVAEVALALDCAHAVGIIHRDVKPSNLLLAPDGRIVIGDFGLARIGDDPGMTCTGEIIGSPAYMSPEQASGGSGVDRRTDVYSLGATLYELLTLRPPFAGTRRDEVLHKIVHDDPLPPSHWNPRVPRELETICLHAINKDPARRYQTAGELARDLAQFCAGGSIAARRTGRLEQIGNWSRRRPGMAATACALLAVALLAGYFAHSAWSSRAAFVAAQLQDAVDDALIANMSGDSDAADRAVARVAALSPETGWLPFLHGHLAFQRGDYDGGVTRLKQAAAQLPDSVAARALLAAAHVGAGWWEHYEDVLDDLEKMTPQTAEDFMFRGLAESYLDPARARASLDEAIRMRRLPAAYVMRAEVCAHLAMDTAQRADADAAVADADLACVLLPGNPAALQGRLFAHHVAAGVYSRLDLDEQADSLLSAAEADAAALERYSHLPSIARARAWFYLHTGDEPQAFAILRDAAARTDNARVAYRYALLLYRRGEFAEGLAFLERRTVRSHNEELLRILLLMEAPDGLARARGAYQTLVGQATGGLAALFHPALLLVMGDKPAAIEDSRALRNRRPDGLPPLRRSFYTRLLQFNCDELSEDELLESAGSSQWDRCEAQFFVGLARLAEGRRDQAAEHFRAAVDTRCDGFLAYDWSEIFLRRLASDVNWPTWISSGPNL